MISVIHKKYGVSEIPLVKILNIVKSNHKHKKYSITVEYNDKIKTIHFGDTRYQQYKDRTPLKLYKHLDHEDKDRRDNYLSRATKILNDKGLAVNDPFSPNRYAVIYLW
jgi:hypothetical protein